MDTDFGPVQLHPARLEDGTPVLQFGDEPSLIFRARSRAHLADASSFGCVCWDLCEADASHRSLARLYAAQNGYDLRALAGA